MDDPFSGELERRFDWGEFLHTWIFRIRSLLIKYWWILLACISVSVTVQAFLELRQEPVYQSTARLWVTGQIVLPEGQIYQEEFNRFYETQIDLMLSGRIRQGAYARVGAVHPEIPRNPVNLRAYVQPDTSIFVLVATSPHREYSSAYLDALLDEYINFRKEMRSQTSEGVYLAITEELIRVEEDIETQEQKIVDFQKRNNVTFIQARVDNISARLIMLNNQLADLRSEYRLISTLSLEQQLEGAAEREYGSEQEGTESNAIALISGNPDYIEAKQRLNKLEAELTEYSLYLRPKHPKIIQYNLDIERMRNRLESIRKQSAKRLDEAKEILEIRIADKQSEIAELEDEALDYQQRLADYQQLSSRLELLKGSRQRLEQRLKTIETNFQQEMLGILERASSATEIGGSVLRKVIEGVVIGLFLGGGIIFVLGLLDNRILGTEDLADRFDEPVLGVIPYEPTAKGKLLAPIEPDDERHTFAEACRNLRSSLLFMEREHGPSRVILVTSAVPGEGKSTIASNLALSLAFAKYRTLLIDADLRRGRLAQTLSLNREPGLSELLQERMALGQVIQKTDYAWLDVIGSGSYPDRPGEILLDDYFNRILIDAREAYQYVIIDSAPILATDDTTSFVNRVDDVIFAVRSGFSRARQIRPAIERLNLQSREVTGLVLNFMDAREPNYYYYKYHDYYTSPARRPAKEAPSAQSS